MKVHPKILRDRGSRRRARWVRDRQWLLMERAARHDPLWFTPWNKGRRAELSDEWRDGLITGMEVMDFMAKHKDWFRVGRWSNKREARPIRLTVAGRKALKDRTGDMDPVFGGLVEPGWQCVPLPPPKSAHTPQ